MSKEYSLNNFNQNKRLSNSDKNELLDKILEELVGEDKTLKAEPAEINDKVKDLLTKYSYNDVWNLSKKYNLQGGRKIEMLKKLTEKGLI